MAAILKKKRSQMRLSSTWLSGLNAELTDASIESSAPMVAPPWSWGKNLDISEHLWFLIFDGEHLSFIDQDFKHELPVFQNLMYFDLGWLSYG